MYKYFKRIVIPEITMWDLHNLLMVSYILRLDSIMCCIDYQKYGSTQNYL